MLVVLGLSLLSNDEVVFAENLIVNYTVSQKGNRERIYSTKKDW